jgi:hypothetical protein
MATVVAPGTDRITPECAALANGRPAVAGKPGELRLRPGRPRYGVAMLDEHDSMIGSVMIVDFPNRSGVDAWLQTEPYVTGGVWQTIDIKPCRVGPSFIGLHKKTAAA